MSYKIGRGRIGPGARYAVSNLQEFGQPFVGASSHDVRSEVASNAGRVRSGDPGAPRNSLPVDRPHMRNKLAVLLGVALVVWAAS